MKNRTMRSSQQKKIAFLKKLALTKAVCEEQNENKCEFQKGDDN